MNDIIFAAIVAGIFIIIAAILAKSSLDYTNIAYTNSTNTFMFNQTFNNSVKLFGIKKCADGTTACLNEDAVKIKMPSGTLCCG